MTLEETGLGPTGDALAVGVELADIVDLDALRAIAHSVYLLFAVPVRVFSKSGALVAEVGAQAAICGLVNGVPDGRKACAAVVTEVKRQGVAADAPRAIACFTSARYEIVPVEHQGERGGRFVIGPYRLTTEPTALTGELPKSLLAVDARLDAARARSLLPEMVTLSPERAEQLCDHVRLVLENVMRAGYQALVTSRMHLAATRESYRELREKHAQLQDANRRLQELDSLKTSFLSTVSHELRTPLTSIIGYGDMLLDGMAGPLTDEQKNFLSVVRRQSDQLLHLITTLLDASRLERGAMPIQKQPTKIQEVLADVVSTLAPRAIEKGVYLELSTPDPSAAPSQAGAGAGLMPGPTGVSGAATGDARGRGPDGGLPLVHADPNRLRQVFLNLVENAVKFSPSDGSGIVSLTTRVIEDADADRVGYILFAPLERKLEVRVADSGPGIPDRAKRRVFDPFYQVANHSTREYSGSGLGLSIVKQLVEAHAGTVTVEDNAGGGSVFVVRLPVWTGQM